MRVTAVASPSLALIKYWGKLPGGDNLPATSSLAITLDGISTRTVVTEGDGTDTVSIDGVPQPTHRFAAFFDAVRAYVGSISGGRRHCFSVESSNSFPTAAGLASSSSGFAALATAAVRLCGVPHPPPEAISSLARVGSGSAARAVFGGFTEWRRGGQAASPVAAEDHWPQLRVIAVVVAGGAKNLSSREAMERTRLTSPYYPAWTHNAEETFVAARQALLERSMEPLGRAMRMSYLRMFATMLAAAPPVRYWRPQTLVVLDAVETLQAAGLPVFETMDAGPQVKLLTLASHVDEVSRAVGEAFADSGWDPPELLVCTAGAGARVIAEEP